jgi:TolB-like protein
MEEYMKKLLIPLAATIVMTFAACSTIDVALSKRVDVNKKMKKIAVLPFDVKGADWGDEFSDSIIHQFFKSSAVEVVEREAIERILKEQRLSMSGLIDDTQVVKIGKLLGADVIVLGRGSALRHHSAKGTEVPNLIDTFSLKAISVEKGELLFTVRKEPGIAWDGRYRAKFCLSGTLIWDRNDVLEESSRYDDISKQIVKKILESIARIEKEKNIK